MRSYAQYVTGLASRIGILAPFRIRDFRLLWTGMFVSMVGDGFYFVAIAWQVFDLSDSPSALAYVGLAWSLPQVLLVFLSGALADRLDRRFLMIAGDLIRCAAIVTVGVLSIAGVLTIPMMVGLVMVFGVGQALFQPSFQSIVPLIVPPGGSGPCQLRRPVRAAVRVDGARAGAGWRRRRHGGAWVGVHRGRRHVRVLRRS